LLHEVWVAIHGGAGCGEYGLESVGVWVAPSFVFYRLVERIVKPRITSKKMKNIPIHSQLPMIIYSLAQRGSSKIRGSVASVIHNHYPLVLLNLYPKPHPNPKLLRKV
jgi:hypothetical protein